MKKTAHELLKILGETYMIVGSIGGLIYAFVCSYTLEEVGYHTETKFHGEIFFGVLIATVVISLTVGLLVYAAGEALEKQKQIAIYHEAILRETKKQNDLLLNSIAGTKSNKTKEKDNVDAGKGNNSEEEYKLGVDGNWKCLKCGTVNKKYMKRCFKCLAENPQ